MAWRRHKELLDKAAGVSTVNLVCHPETWRRVSPWAFNVVISTVPVPDREPLEMVALPGPRLITVLGSLYVRAERRNPEIQALATRMYEGIAELINGVEQGAADGAPIPGSRTGEVA